MAKKYQMVRVTDKTHGSLAALQQIFAADHADGKAQHEFDERSGLPTLDYVINVLLAEYWGHRQRKRDESRRQTIQEALATLDSREGKGKPLSSLLE